MSPLTPAQQRVLAVVCGSPRGHASYEDIAFEAGTTPQAAGRVVLALSARGLVTRQRFTDWEVWPTEAGHTTYAALNAPPEAGDSL